MSIEVKCVCGRVVFADDNQAGSYLQCPHCKASVAVPTGVAHEQPPAPPAPPNPGEEAAFELIGCVIVGILIWIFSEELNPKLAKGLLFVCVLGIGHAISTMMKGK